MALLRVDDLWAADAADLLYVSDEIPGIRRRRCGRGFTYVGPDGLTITDPAERDRIEGLVIPPAWTDVWICPTPDGHVLATGRDAKGRKQYRYHPRWIEIRDATKFDRLSEFGALLPDLRAGVDADLRRRGLPREKVLALVVRLLDETLIRIGNSEYADTNESYGLTTLAGDHVEVTGSTVRFEFVGKGGAEHVVAVRDPRLARLVQQCHELRGHVLFCYEDEDGATVSVSSGDVNEYLRDRTGAAVTSKTFRTWGGTVVAAEALAALGPPAEGVDADAQILGAIDAAAGALGNTRAVCRASYVHPAVPEAHRSGALHEAWRRSRSTGRLRRGERAVLKVVEAEERRGR